MKTNSTQKVKAWGLANTGFFSTDYGIYPLTAYKSEEAARYAYEEMDKTSVVLFPFTITYKLPITKSKK